MAGRAVSAMPDADQMESKGENREQWGVPAQLSCGLQPQAKGAGRAVTSASYTEWLLSVRCYGKPFYVVYVSLSWFHVLLVAALEIYVIVPILQIIKSKSRE